MTHEDDLRALYDAQTYATSAPHDAIDRLREHGPVVWVPEPALHGFPEGPGYWAVLGHAETKQVLRDAATFSSNLGGTQLRTPTRPEDLAFVRQMMLNQDPPAHSRLRGLLSKAFIPRAIAALDTEISTRARDLVHAVAHQGQCDLVTDVVGDLPVAVLASVLGLPEHDRGLLYDWSNRVIGYQDADYATSDSFDPATGSDMARAALALRPQPDDSGALPDPRTRAGMADMYAYAQALAEFRRREPGDDIVSLLMHAEFDGTALTNDEFETTLLPVRRRWQRDAAQRHPRGRAVADREPGPIRTAVTRTRAARRRCRRVTAFLATGHPLSANGHHHYPGWRAGHRRRRQGGCLSPGGQSGSQRIRGSSPARPAPRRC